AARCPRTSLSCTTCARTGPFSHAGSSRCNEVLLNQWNCLAEVGAGYEYGEMSAPSSPLPARYSDPRPIGQGGMGDVFAANDTELDREVAIKILAAGYADDEPSPQGVKQEALAAARLSGHPHVVTIFDVGEVDERPFIVMELLHGGTVADRIAAGAVPRGEALRWLHQTADALDAAHAEGIVHRDVKS